VGTYVALYNLAQLALARGDLGPAADALEEGVGLSGHTKDRANLAHFLEALSAVAALRGEVERAAVLIGAAEGSLKELGTPVYHYYIPDPSLRERAVAEARASLGMKPSRRRGHRAER
jgi:ATP/maltotriose-dependent transcriptional regulator MalT